MRARLDGGWLRLCDPATALRIAGACAYGLLGFLTFGVSARETSASLRIEWTTDVIEATNSLKRASEIHRTTPLSPCPHAEVAPCG